MATAKPKPLVGAAAVKEYQKQVSPKGVAAAEKRARAAIEKKYPGMFIPNTRVAKSADEARLQSMKRGN